VKTGFIGDEVILPCTSTVLDAPVTWFDQKKDSRMYEIGVVTDGYRNIVSDRLVNKSVGDYTLVLKNVSRSSSGSYLCTEAAGHGRKHAVTVNVSGE
jgi:Immunoglobulin domain